MMIRHRNYLVTGGAGFIGSHLVEALVSLGARVRVLDDFSSGRKENLASVESLVEVIVGDVRDLSTCLKAAEGIEVILHQAALASVPRSVSEPLLAHEVNLTGTLNLLQAAALKKVKSFVFASSSAVYGENPVLPKKEGQEGKPLSPYAAQKLASEKYLQVFSELYGFNAVSLRYFNVFGPRQNPASQYAAVIPVFITRMLNGLPPVIYGDGTQTRDFIYVQEVVRANLIASGFESFRGEVFNIGASVPVSINELVEIINSLLGLSIKAIYTDPRPGDIKESFADISQAEKLLGFRPELDFKSGLKLTLEWYKKQKF
jgi:UDP-glucose 4-epimerase